MLGFGLSWLPYVGIIGGLVALAGVIFLIRGRWAFGLEHRRNIGVGGTVYFLSILFGVVVSLAFVAALQSQLSVPYTNTPLLSSELSNDFTNFFIGAAVAGILGVIGQMVMVYALADESTRLMLWAGLAVGVAVSILTGAILLPQISGAVQSALSSNPVYLAPINQLTSTETLISMLRVGPSFLFAWAYYRCRESTMEIRDRPASSPAPA